MFTAAAKIGYDDLEAIAARCYLDLLRGGYTGVAEFLYLHRLRHGSNAPPVADVTDGPAAAPGRLPPTLLPTLYPPGNFGRDPPAPAQWFFIPSSAPFLQESPKLRRRSPLDGETVV